MNPRRSPEEDALAALRDDPPPAPSEGLVDRAVLRAVQRRAQEPERGPRRVPVQWLLGVVAGASLVLFGMLLGRGPVDEGAASTASTPIAAPSTTSDDGDNVYVRFVLPAEGAEHVAVAGDFNDWSADTHTLEGPDPSGVFHATLPLPRGEYAYMFVVDGERWVTDPFAGAYRDDGFGHQNAILRVD